MTKFGWLETGVSTLIADRRLCAPYAICKRVGDLLIHGNSPPFAHPMANQQTTT